MDTKDKIINAALDLFGEKGYNCTSIQEISDQAGISKGAVFHYFQSKGELLFVIHENFINVHLKQAEGVLQNQELNAADKLRRLVTDLVQLIADFKPDVVVFFQEFKYIPREKFKVIKEKRDRCEQIFRTVVEQGVQNGEFRNDLDIDIMVKGIFGMCDWTHIWMHPAGRLTPQQIGESFWAMLFSGIRNDKNRQ